MKVMPKKQQSKTAYTDYSAAQKQAKEKRKGLWKKDNPQAPWQFRRQNYEQQNGNKKQSDNNGSGLVGFKRGCLKTFRRPLIIKV